MINSTQDPHKMSISEERLDNTKHSTNLLIPDENLSGEMQILYAKDFSRLVVQRGHHLREIEKAFSVELNRKCIKKMGKSKKGGGDGGASGEFFFVTHDGRFFIKTITEEEEVVFMDMIGEYITHLLENGNSLIGRIVGYFVFKFDILDQQIKVIIIENIFLLEKNLIRRKYDLKGSTYKRKVLKASDRRISMGSDLKQEFKENNTMKDLDFNKIEGKIVLNEEDYYELLNLINKDVTFFRDNQVIDYSLIIAVVKMQDLHDLPGQQNTKAKREINELIKKKMFYLDSELEFGYLVGIIDYFQLFTFSKWMEKYMKILVNCKLGLDTSSQPADKYAQRYYDYVSSIFVASDKFDAGSHQNWKVGHSFNQKNTLDKEFNNI